MRNNPPRKKQGRPISSEKPNQENEPTTTIMNLDDASLGTILEFLPGHFRFVANVNRRFRFLYHHTPNTIYGAAMTSDATRAIWLDEDKANVRESACGFAARLGNLEALQWLRSHDCRWTIGVCEDAAICISCIGRGRKHRPVRGTTGRVEWLL